MHSVASHAKAGISRYCSGLIEGLAELNSEHEFFIFTGPDFEPSESLRSNQQFHFPKAEGPFLGNKLLREVFVGGRWIRQYKLDRYLSTAHGLPLRRGIPSGIVVHDLFPATHPELFSKKDAIAITKVNSWAMKSANVVLANSEFTKREILRLNHLPEKKIKVIPLSIGNLLPPVGRESALEEKLKSLGITSPDYFFTIGTLEPRKNLPRLIEAFAEVAKDRPGVHLAIAGAKGWKDHAIAQTVSTLGLEGRIHFLGYVDDADLPMLFAGCRAFICSSLTEGFGIPVLEAQHFGAPVITSTGGALPEVANPRSILFDPLDVQAIRAALDRSFSEFEDRQPVIEEGFRFAEQFSWKRTSQETLDALIDLPAR